MPLPHAPENTLAMTVANTGFMLDRLGQDCSPLQFLRELTQNAIEAIEELPDKTGEIVWDVDWNRHALAPTFKLSITDSGIGMTGPDMIRYINQLSSSAHVQSYEGNFGVGAKIAAATRNHAGLIYLSWKDGVGAMIHLWRDPDTLAYGLRQFEWPDGTYNHWLPISDDLRPGTISDHGTMVVLLGNDIDEDTMAAPTAAASPSRWIARYLNTRYYSFPPGATVRAREGWEYPRTNTDTNVLRTVTGQGPYLERHSEKNGALELTGATAHWWILKDESALSQNSGFLASNGHAAALYQNELYELAVGRSATARLQNFGVIFGHDRVVIYIEPMPGTSSRVTPNTARTQLLIDGNPLPWSDWAAEFRAALPDEIKELMEEVTAGSHSSDHRQAIRERLKAIRDLFRLSRYRPSANGRARIDPDSLISGGEEEDDQSRLRKRTAGGGGGRGGGRAGDIYALFVATDGIPAERVTGDADPIVQWITAAEGTRVAGDLEDRAAKYLYEQNLLQINGDFRVFTDFVDRWVARYSDVPGAREVIQDTAREWFEQALIEAVVGTKALLGSKEWGIGDLEKSLSEEALTAAVMPRYHIEMAVRRALGARLGTLKDRAAG